MWIYGCTLKYNVLSFLFKIAFILGIAQIGFSDCIHNKLNIKLDYLKEPEYSTNRILSTDYAGIRIYPDYTYLTNVTSEMREYIINELVPPALSFFKAALKVVPLQGKITIPSREVCDFPTPSIYFRTGVEADLIIFVRATNSDENYIAAARPCSLLMTTNRPVIGELFYNVRAIQLGDPMEHQSHIATTLHEMTHVLGFSSALYEYFIDPISGYPLSGHIKRRVIHGMNVYMLDLKPLTPRVRNHFGCNTVEGAYLEDEGGAGSQGSHWERRLFYNEYMTSSDITDSRVTEFTLALLEGTGWYKVNYEVAEPFIWGKGKGCDFIYKDCINPLTKAPAFEEFCSPLASKGCTFSGRAQGYCGATRIITDPKLNPEIDYWNNQTVTFDPFADNCPYVMDYANADCENPAYSYIGKVSAEKFGKGSKCFTGNFLKSKPAKSTQPYCLKYSCTPKFPGEYELKIEFDSNSVICRSKGPTDVPGYAGQIDCPDPNHYCQTVGLKYCPRGCMGNGE